MPSDAADVADATDLAHAAAVTAAGPTTPEPATEPATDSVADLEQATRGADIDAALRAVARLRRLAEQLEADRVAAARRAGWSWQDIAERLGVTKQTVHRKHHRSQKG